MTPAESHDRLLASVSRSFYVSLRFLPAPVRGPLSLGYLLARAADTIADTAVISPAQRMAALEGFLEWIHGRGALPPMEPEAGWKGMTEGETRLLASLPELKQVLSGMSGEDRLDILEVLGHITRGQRGDLERFALPASGTGILETAGELLNYTWLVAGCVGEFWTKLCARKLPRFSTTPVEEMIRKGAAFGRGLQLVNILRDFPADLAVGRCYLPAEEIAAAGLDLEQVRKNPALATPMAAVWLDRAGDFLRDGLDYAERLRSIRLRFSCMAPAIIGEETLKQVRSRFGIPGVKISRAEVKAALLRSAKGALFGPKR